jgi:hypothetical protein
MGQWENDCFQGKRLFSTSLAKMMVFRKLARMLTCAPASLDQQPNRSAQAGGAGPLVGGGIRATTNSIIFGLRTRSHRLEVSGLRGSRASPLDNQLW